MEIKFPATILKLLFANAKYFVLFFMHNAVKIVHYSFKQQNYFFEKNKIYFLETWMNKAFQRIEVNAKNIFEKPYF